MFIVIVNYRAAQMTVEAVASLRKCPEFGDVSVVIVDNGSEDGSLEILRRECGDCTVIDAGANLGFSGGNNVGIRHALANGAKWILLLNNDTLVHSDFLRPLIAAASDGKTLATPKILCGENSECIWYGGGHVDYRRGGFYHETDAASSAVARDVTFASGCCLLIPAKFFSEHGLMDESYFLYYEDSALCLTALAAGYRIRYVPESVIRHRVSATIGADSALTAYYGTRNRLMVLSRFKFPFVAFAYVLATRLAKLALAPFRPNLRFIAAGIFDWLRGIDGPRHQEIRHSTVINGVFASRRATGLERFAWETLRALDWLVPPGRFILAIPRNTPQEALPNFRNISIVRCGIFRGAAWEQLSLPRFARKRRAEILSLTNTAPFFCGGCACIHDVFYVTHALQFRKSLRGRLSMVWHRLHYRAIAKRARIVFTVSEYSARAIRDVLGVDRRRTVVLGNGWEHMMRIASDDRVFSRFPQIAKGEYFFALGNRSPYKNIEWIYSAAERHPSSRWVVTGAMLKSAEATRRILPNVVHTGYVSDGEMKALMANCRALVFPSLDEGFGIPPLEALALGKPAIVARSAGLPEIYADAVHWIDDPTAPADPDELLRSRVSPPDGVLERFSWRNAASTLFSAF